MDIVREISDDEWKQRIVLASVPFWKYQNGIPIANASGCLIDFAGCRFLLSIAHASISESEWNVEINSVAMTESGPQVSYQPVRMNSLFALEVNLEQQKVSEGKIVDFTYRRVPNTFTSHHVVAIAGNEMYGADRTVFSPNFDLPPSANSRYGFYGNVKFDGTIGRRIIFDHRLESDLRLVGRRGQFLQFRLPHKYGSHNNYIGCSGAPIISENNQLVALVSFGERVTNSIFGIDISQYQYPLRIDAQI